MNGRILVPLDGSPFSEHALPLALSIAERWKGSLHLATVHEHTASWVEAQMPILDSSSDQMGLDARRDYLDRISDLLGKMSRVTPSMAVLQGPQAQALCEEASASGADLIIMTTHGRGPLNRLWLGSVADQVVRRSPVPVMLLRPEERDLNLRERPVLDRLFIPLDGSRLAEQILPWACAVGEIMEAKITLFRAIEPVIVPSSGWGGNVLNGLSPEQLETVRKSAMDYLDRVEPQMNLPPARVQKIVSVNVPAASAILGEAAAIRANLIALQTHGRGGWKRLLLGSVADKIIRAANIPILVGKPTAH